MIPLTPRPSAISTPAEDHSSDVAGERPIPFWATVAAPATAPAVASDAEPKPLATSPKVSSFQSGSAILSFEQMALMLKKQGVRIIRNGYFCDAGAFAGPHQCPDCTNQFCQARKDRDQRQPLVRPSL